MEPEGTSAPPELAPLIAAATHQLDQHVDDDGRCVACGLEWPCQRAVAAAAALCGL